ncbi:MAG: hypothetical protein HRT35_14315 [Algicola sp.]|nr:hypothetical protein [Algicola sp.]
MYVLGGATVLITDAFAHAQKSIQTAHRTNIEYHWQYGFPNLISSDWNADIIDDECFYQIENFEVIK